MPSPNLAQNIGQIDDRMAYMPAQVILQGGKTAIEATGRAAELAVQQQAIGQREGEGQRQQQTAREQMESAEEISAARSASFERQAMLGEMGAFNRQTRNLAAAREENRLKRDATEAEMVYRSQADMNRLQAQLHHEAGIAAYAATDRRQLEGQRHTNLMERDSLLQHARAELERERTTRADKLLKAEHDREDRIIRETRERQIIAERYGSFRDALRDERIQRGIGAAQELYQQRVDAGEIPINEATGEPYTWPELRSKTIVDMTQGTVEPLKLWANLSVESTVEAAATHNYLAQRTSESLEAAVNALKARHKETNDYGIQVSNYYQSGVSLDAAIKRYEDDRNNHGQPFRATQVLQDMSQGLSLVGQDVAVNDLLRILIGSPASIYYMKDQSPETLVGAAYSLDHIVRNAYAGKLVAEANKDKRLAGYYEEMRQAAYLAQAAVVRHPTYQQWVATGDSVKSSRAIFLITADPTATPEERKQARLQLMKMKLEAYRNLEKAGAKANQLVNPNNTTRAIEQSLNAMLPGDITQITAQKVAQMQAAATKAGLEPITSGTITGAKPALVEPGMGPPGEGGVLDLYDEDRNTYLPPRERAQGVANLRGYSDFRR